MLTDDGRRTTDAGVTGILLAHLGAFGSGELIKEAYQKQFCFSRKTAEGIHDLMTFNIYA